MLHLNKFKQIYLYRPYIDFRKGARSLASIVQDEMNLDPFQKYLFLFCNQVRNRLKVLYWDDSGFALWYKHLEEGKFKWPHHLEDINILTQSNQLRQFLSGLNPWEQPHKKLNYTSI